MMPSPAAEEVANGSIFQPFRIHCPDCLGKNTVIDMTDIAKKTAKVHTFMVCMRSGAFNVLGSRCFEGHAPPTSAYHPPLSVRSLVS